MSKDFTISLDSILNPKIEETVQTEILTESKITPAVEETVLVDIDAILTEWAWRCEKGYPNYNDKNDMIKLQEVLDEMGVALPFNRLKEATPVSKKVTVPKKVADMFTDEGIDTLGYTAYKNKIKKAFADYLPKANPAVIKLIGSVNSYSQLKTAIKAHKNDQLLVALYNISGKEAQAGQRESGRGAMGRGEVLIGYLSGEKSGGTATTDNQIGGIGYEVKASSAKNFKVPLAAKRIDRLTTLSRLDDLYFICKPVIKLKKSWDGFLKDMDKQLGDDKLKMGKTMSNYLFDAGIAPSSGNINSTELANFVKFVKACNTHYYASKTAGQEDLYIDLDSTTGIDKLLRGKLKNPKDVSKIKSGSDISISVTNAVADNAKAFETFEARLKQHPYVVKPDTMLKDLRTDLSNILANNYIVFHETKDLSVVPDPVLLDPSAKGNTKISGFTLNQAIVDFKDAK
jgi:hypothetical protein